MAGLDIIQEAERQLILCNACRYCEGYCPVFRAIEARREFGRGDVYYLANLCHDCRACYYACMFTPPHEFAINIPKILSEARAESYQRWSWPALFGKGFQNRRVTVLLGAGAAVIVALIALFFIPTRNLFAAHLGPGAFYEIVPYFAMVSGALILFIYGVAIWLRGGSQFWKETSGALRSSGGARTLLVAIGAVLGLRYLKGGGPGCFYPHEQPSATRRLFHSLTFWGFAADFLSTTLAAIYQDILHRLPPYPLDSAPVIFGAVGGAMLILGAAGLIWLKRKSDLEPAGPGASGMDYVFLFTLGFAALTGLLTLFLRATSAMGSVLVLHLACVAALFITAPYGKFVHALYRTLAIVRYEMEQGQAGQASTH